MQKLVARVIRQLRHLHARVKPWSLPTKLGLVTGITGALLTFCAWLIPGFWIRSPLVQITPDTFPLTVGQVPFLRTRVFVTNPRPEPVYSVVIAIETRSEEQ